MADIYIHRCTLRVVRRGGWSWGPNPKQLVDEVVRFLPALLARKLEELFPGDEDREFAAPICIRIPFRPSDLPADAQSSPQSNLSSDHCATASFDEKVGSALYNAFGSRKDLESETLQPERYGASTEDIEVIAQTHVREGGALQYLLLRWSKEGVLESRLAALPAQDIEAWHRTVWPRPTDSGGTEADFDQLIEQKFETEVNQRLSRGVAGSGMDRLRRRLLLATELAAQFRVALSYQPLTRALDRFLPVGDLPAVTLPTRTRTVDGLDSCEAEVDSSSTPLTETGTNFTPSTALPVRIARQKSSAWEVRVQCALPFLLLGPLSQVGYFDALAAVLEVAGLSNAAPLFATALAYKVLDAPERGWRRTQESVLAATAFAGLNEPATNEVLVGFSRRIAPHTGLLDLSLTETMVEAHTTGAPVFLHRAEFENSRGFMLIESEGCFPIAWADDYTSLLPALRRLDDAVVLISRDAAEPRLLRDLDAEGFSFVSDVPPTRNECWRRIQQGPLLSAWTNHSAPESEAAMRAARDIETASEDARTLWDTMAIARPSVVHASLPQLDRSLTLAAAVATGMIAWKLWQARGRTRPQMALERYCDFDARIEFGPESVLVHLPLGRRYQDLYERGLLASVRDIPWVGGHRVEFDGG